MKGKVKVGQQFKSGGTSYRKQIGRLGTVGKNIELKQQKQYRSDVMQYKSDLAKEIKADKVIDNKGGFSLVKGFQQYKFSDTGRGLEYVGAELYVPEGYTKVNNKLLASPQQYVKSSRETSRGKVRQTDTYVPKEIMLDDKGNITQIVERKVYKSYEKDSKRDREEYDVYVSKVQKFSDGQLVGEEVYSPYEQTYKKNGGRKLIKKQVYKQSESVYDPSGTLSRQLVYSPYAISKRRTDGGSREQYGVYLQSSLDVNRGERLEFRRPETQKVFKDKNLVTPLSSNSSFRTLTPDQLSQNQSRLPGTAPSQPPKTRRFVRGLFGLK